MEKKILTENEARQMLPNNIEFVKEEGLMERLNVEGYMIIRDMYYGISEQMINVYKRYGLSKMAG